MDDFVQACIPKDTTATPEHVHHLIDGIVDEKTEPFAKSLLRRVTQALKDYDTIITTLGEFFCLESSSSLD